jgi:hypothetical protein
MMSDITLFLRKCQAVSCGGFCRFAACRVAAKRLFLGMVIIHFEDAEMEKKALEFLAGRCSFKTWESGDLMLPEPAVGELAARGIVFQSKGPATYEHFLPSIRNPVASAV